MRTCATCNQAVEDERWATLAVHLQRAHSVCPMCSAITIQALMLGFVVSLDTTGAGACLLAIGPPLPI